MSGYRTQIRHLQSLVARQSSPQMRGIASAHSPGLTGLNHRSSSRKCVIPGLIAHGLGDGLVSFSFFLKHL
jgi:hypothetical protein